MGVPGSKTSDKKSTVVDYSVSSPYSTESGGSSLGSSSSTFMNPGTKNPAGLFQSHQELDTGMVVLTRAQVQLALCTKKKWKWPSQAMLHSAWNDIVFNMKYWTSLQDQW